MAPRPAPPAQESVPLDALLQRYLAHVQFEKRLAPRSVTLYTLELQRLQQLLARDGLALLAVGPAHIRRWVAQLHSAGRSGRGLALVLSVWRGFYTWAARQAYVTSNPVTAVRAPKAAKPLPKALAVDAAVQLADFEASDQDPFFQARDQAMVELLYGSGLRLSELTALDVAASAQARAWVDVQAAEAHVLGKGNKRRVVPVGQAALQALQSWLSVRDQAPVAHQPALFVGRGGTRLSAQSVWQRLRRRSLQAGLPVAVHPHMLRHSCASHLLQSSGDLRGVQELLGHASIATTQVYTRLDFGHLSKVYDAAHPRASVRAQPQAQGDTIFHGEVMHKQITVVLDQRQELTFKVPDGGGIGPDAARAWLDEQFIKLDCEPLRASGKVLTADKILLVTQAAGETLFQDATWTAAYVAAVSCALAKPMVRVDVPSMSITY